MKLEERIERARRLVQKGQRPGRFVESTLMPLVQSIINDSRAADAYSEQTKVFLLEIVRMEKSTFGGQKLYGGLERSTLPYAEEVLREAMDVDPYYNCNHEASHSYFRLALRNIGVTEDVITVMFQDPSRYDTTASITTLCREPRPSHLTMNERLRSTICIALDPTVSNQWFIRYQSLMAAPYLHVQDAVPPLLRMMRSSLDRAKETSTGALRSVTAEATALAILTGKRKYWTFAAYVGRKYEQSRSQPATTVIGAIERRTAALFKAV